MEIKKSRKADLEHGWIRRFLVGLLVSSTCFFLCLMIPFPDDDPLDDPDLLEMFSMDEDLSSLMRPENELALAPKVEPEPSKKLVVKDEEQDAEMLKEILEKEYEKEVTLITWIGSVIGAQSGPGTLALFFMGKER